MSLADTTILEAASIPDIWRPWFRDRSTWAPWFTFLRALFGLPLHDTDIALFRLCTGRAASGGLRRGLAHLRSACGQIVCAGADRGVSRDL